MTTTINDAGSTFTVDDTFSVRGGFLEIDKGTLKVNSQLLLDGGSPLSRSESAHDRAP